MARNCSVGGILGWFCTQPRSAYVEGQSSEHGQSKSNGLGEKTPKAVSKNDRRDREIVFKEHVFPPVVVKVHPSPLASPVKDSSRSFPAQTVVGQSLSVGHEVVDVASPQKKGLNQRVRKESDGTRPVTLTFVGNGQTHSVFTVSGEVDAVLQAELASSDKEISPIKVQEPPLERQFEKPDLFAPQTCGDSLKEVLKDDQSYVSRWTRVEENPVLEFWAHTAGNAGSTLGKYAIFCPVGAAIVVIACVAGADYEDVAEDVAKFGSKMGRTAALLPLAIVSGSIGAIRAVPRNLSKSVKKFGGFMTIGTVIPIMGKAIVDVYQAVKKSVSHSWAYSEESGTGWTGYS
jgi:hypothetical protein